MPFENIHFSLVSWFGFFFFIHWWVWFLTSFSFPILFIPNCLVSRYGMWIPEAWRISSPHYSKYPLSNRPLYRPSATGVRVAVWYLHLVLHLIVVIRVSQALVFSSQWPVEQFWTLCFVRRLGFTPVEDSQGSINTTARSYHVWVTLTICLTSAQ